MNSAATDPRKCARCAKIFIYLCITEAVIFLVLKVTLGLSTGSRALMVASLYSLQDLVASLGAALGMTVSARPPDKTHPYGHGKVEYLVVTLTSIVLLLGILALMITALSDVFQPMATGGAPSAAAVWIALSCGIVCWTLSQMAHCTAGKLSSPALLSCSQHLHGDVVASVAVVVSVIGSHLGFAALDHIVAVAEAFHIVFMSGRMLGAAINGLMDASADPELIKRLCNAIQKVKTVLRIREISARWAGQSLLTQVSVEVEGQMKAAEADELRTQIEQVIREQHDSDAAALAQIMLVPAPSPGGPTPEKE